MSPCPQPCEVLREAFRKQNVLLKLSCWFWAVFFFFFGLVLHLLYVFVLSALPLEGWLEQLTQH